MPNPTVITDAELTGLLKNVYSNFRERVQNLVTPLLAQLQKGKAGGPRNMRWGGNNVYFDVVVGRPAGSTFSQSGYFPPDTTAQEVQGNVGVRRAYTTRQIDGLTFAGTASKQAAFTTIVQKTMQEIKDASSLLMQQALHNKEDGVLALATATMANATTLIVNSPYGLANAGQGSLLISVGDYLALLDTSAADAVLGRAQVSSIAVSGDTATITFAGAGIASFASSALGDKVVKATASDTSFNTAMNGLVSITNRGGSYTTLHNINSSTYPIWDSVRMTAPDATQPTESDIWDLIQLINGRSGKNAMVRPGEFLLMSTPGIGKKLMESVVGQRRFSASDITTTIKGGYKAIEICGIPMVLDYYVPAGTIYLLHIPSLAWVDAKDWGFVEFEGAGPWRWLQGRDAFETTYGWYGNLACLARNAHGIITGYNDTTRYSHVV